MPPAATEWAEVGHFSHLLKQNIGYGTLGFRPGAGCSGVDGLRLREAEVRDRLVTVEKKPGPRTRRG